MNEMNLWKNLPTGPKPPERVWAVVEVPRGGRVKYEFDHSDGVWFLKLDRVLSSPMFYIGNYGIIPQTLWDDGDPMDILVLMSEPVQPGAVIEVRPVALLEMIDDGVNDHKVIAVPEHDPMAAGIQDLKDINIVTQNELTQFFRTYKVLEGKEVEIRGWKGKDIAYKAIIHSQKLFKEKVGK